LRVGKLLKLHQTKGRISSNLLNASNPAGKQATYAAGLALHGSFVHTSQARGDSKRCL